MNSAPASPASALPASPRPDARAGTPGSSLVSVLRLIRLGLTAEMRNPGLRLLAVLGAVFAGLYAWDKAEIAGMVAVALSSWLGRLYGFAACLWMGYAAIRDQNAQLGAVLRSKPVDGARWVLVSWATGLCVWLLLLGAAFLGAALAQLPNAGLVSLYSHALGFARAAVLISALGTLAYALSRLWRSPLGGVLTMFAWFCAMAGLKYIPAYLQPDYVQNRSLFIAVAVLMLTVTGWLVERARRGELRRPLAPALVTLALLPITALAANQVYHASPVPQGDLTSVWEYVARQHVQEGLRTPGLWLPDGKGGRVRTAAYHGKILILYFFAGDDVDSARELPVLEAMQHEFGGRGVQSIGVCLSPDHGDGWLLAQAAGYHFPIGSDPTTVKTSPPPESSIAAAYNIQLLPTLVVTDRRRRVQALITGTQTLEQVRQLVQQRLTEEPE
jgi:peroxiredoxin